MLKAWQQPTNGTQNIHENTIHRYFVHILFKKHDLTQKNKYFRDGFNNTNHIPVIWLELNVKCWFVWWEEKNDACSNFGAIFIENAYSVFSRCDALNLAFFPLSLFRFYISLPSRNAYHTCLQFTRFFFSFGIHSRMKVCIVQAHSFTHWSLM